MSINPEDLKIDQTIFQAVFAMAFSADGQESLILV
jgi:hypothetical protein